MLTKGRVNIDGEVVYRAKHGVSAGQKIEISDEILKEDKAIVEDLIVAAHHNAKTLLKSKTAEEISKATGGFGIPGFKWPL